jgi:hypothetical protein
LNNIITLPFGTITKSESYPPAGIFAVFINPSQEFKMITWMKAQSIISPYRSTYVNANADILISNFNEDPRALSTPRLCES